MRAACASLCVLPTEIAPTNVPSAKHAAWLAGGSQRHGASGARCANDARPSAT